MKLAILILTIALAGCMPGWKPDTIVKHPDASMLIQETKTGWFGGAYVRVAIYDKVNNKLIDYGWIELDKALQGWTLHKYDWETFIERRSNQ